MNVRPNTVVLECNEFSVLPEESEMAMFLYYEVLKEEENKKIFKEVQALFCDKNARRYLVKLNSPECAGELGELLAEGVSWPGYRNEAAGRDVIVKGYSMEKPIMDITISGVGWWTGQDVIMRVLETWGEVKKITKEEITIQDQNIATGKWKIKLVKKEGIMVPPVVFHAGSERNSEEREMWEIFYRGVPKVCYRCLKPGHLGRECRDDPVNLEQLASQPEYEGAPVAAAVANQEEGVGPRTFAQIVAEPSYTNARVARQQAAEQKREAVAAKLREEKQQRENRTKERDERKKEKLERQASESESESDEDVIAGPDKEGFSINRSGEAATWAHEMNQMDQTLKHKRSAKSPAALVPDKKSKTFSPRNSRTSSPVDHRRMFPPGNN